MIDDVIPLYYRFTFSIYVGLKAGVHLIPNQLRFVTLLAGVHLIPNQLRFVGLRKVRKTFSFSLIYFFIESWKLEIYLKCIQKIGNHICKQNKFPVILL